MYEKQAGSSDLQAWMLESRIRYASVKTAISAVVVLGLAVLVDGLDSLGRGLWFTILVAVVAFALSGWVLYPRAKQSSTTQPGRVRAL